MVIRWKGHIIPRNGTVLEEGLHLPLPGCVCWTRFLSAFHQQPRNHGRLQRNPLAAAPGQLSGGTPLRAEGWGFPNCLTRQRLFLDHLASSCPAFPHTPAGIDLECLKLIFTFRPQQLFIPVTHLLVTVFIFYQILLVSIKTEKLLLLLEMATACIPKISASSSLLSSPSSSSILMSSSCVLGNAMKPFNFYRLISTTAPELVLSQPLVYRVEKSSLRKIETAA